ncbi:MAG: hypothetical protein LUE98_07750 [Tannerellaceae bacterium]|nr:hypothetical protein [Tannerellaceae bacterium]
MAKASKSASEDSPLYKKGLSILKDHPSMEEVYLTANGFGFFSYEEAKNHGQGLKDKSIVHVKRKAK